MYLPSLIALLNHVLHINTLCLLYHGVHECSIVITTISYVKSHCHLILFMSNNSFYSYCLLFTLSDYK